MPRAILLALTVLAACKSADRPAAVDAPAAGKVVELSGPVTAHRGDGPARQLAAGDPVWADDTVATGPGAHVVVLLAKNQVRWSLEAGQSRRVDRSPAWRAEAVADTRTEAPAEIGTSAAGRHSEHEAAAGEAEVAHNQPVVPATSVPDQGPPSDKTNHQEIAAHDSTVESGEASSHESIRVGAVNTPSSAGPSLGLRPGGGTGGGGAGLAASGGGAGVAASDQGLAPVDHSSGAGPSTALKAPLRVHLGRAKATGALDVIIVQRYLRRDLGLVDACARAAGLAQAALKLGFTIDPTGVAHDLAVTGDRDAAAAIAPCVAKVAAGWSFPTAAKATQVTAALVVGK